MTGQSSVSPHVIARLVLSIVGVNVAFLYWGILQEKVTTKPILLIDGTSERFKQYFFLNWVQSFVCFLVSLIFIVFSKPHGHTFVGDVSLPAVRRHFQIGLTTTFGSPLGMVATKYVSYPTVLIAKTCKMLPVMMAGYLLHKARYPMNKVVTVILISVGVLVFTSASEKSKGSHSGDSFIGLFLVFMNLVFDSYTNSTQDDQVKKYNYTAFQMMMWTNLTSFLVMTVVIVLSEFDLLFGLFPMQFSPAIRLCSMSATLGWDIASYAVCGALGQLIIFYILRHFGSLTLTGATVTRKVFSIALSIWTNGHHLTLIQWVALVPVMIGISMDLLFHGKKPHHHKKH
eukprot:PhF_6_TR10957/c0_g1_i1/m.17673/K15275/SLC35B1; solute carrier family 35 (UDP-galactose transporter), member B1